MSSMPKVALDTLKLGLEIVLKVNMAFKSVFLGISMCFKTFCFVLISFYAVLRGLFTFLKMSGLALRGSRKIFSRSRKTGTKKLHKQILMTATDELFLRPAGRPSLDDL